MSNTVLDVSTCPECDLYMYFYLQLQELGQHKEVVKKLEENIDLLHRAIKHRSLAEVPVESATDDVADPVEE